MELRAVNGKTKAVQELLYVLQLEILPGDKPTETNVGWWWIMYDGSMPVAFCGLYKSPNWQGTGYLCRAGVLESHRGRGLQKRLIRVRERKARKLGWTHVVTDTYENPASANSLIKCGFRSYLPRNPWGAKGVAYWIKRLRKETQ
jgi:GNAT superfamily N-acetyltransferase